MHELNKEQRLIKRKKYVLEVRRQLLNNVNTGINFSTGDNESKIGNLNTYGYITKIVLPTAIATFAASNEMFSVSQTPLLSSSKVEDIEEESSKIKESISANRIIDVNILLFSRIFGEMMSYMFECSSLAFMKDLRVIVIIISSLLYSNSSCKYIQEFFTSTKVLRFFKLINKLFTLCDHQFAMVMLEFKNSIL